MEYSNTLDYGMDHRNAMLIFLLKIHIPAVAFYWCSDIDNRCHLIVFIPKLIRPRSCSPIGLVVI